MGISNPNKPRKAAVKGEPVTEEPRAMMKPVSRKKTAQNVSESHEAIVDGKNRKVSDEDVERGKLLAQFHPDNIKYLSEKLGIDLRDARKCDNAFLEDLLYCRVTKPVEMTVTPLAYDYATRTRSLEMPQITLLSSVRMFFPHDSKFRQKAIKPGVKELELKVATYPYHLGCQKTSEDDVQEQPVVEKEAAVKEKLVEFTDAERQALEGIGISSTRLYGGMFNSIDQETKQMIKAGEDFVYTGSVQTEVGPLNVSGIGRLSTEGGVVSASFESLDRQEGDDLMLDIMSARKVGNHLELDFYERDSKGRILHDEAGHPIVNAAGWNLIEYGQAMAPVTGYVHKAEWDDEARRYMDKVVEKKTYQVSAVNGGLVATLMKQQAEGERFEVATKMEDGKVYVNGSLLEFATEKDRDMYVQGYGGVVKGATWKDYRTKRDVKYDAFVVADNKRGGYAVAYSPGVSQKLMDRRAEMLKAEADQAEARARRAALLKPRKQGFSIKH